MPEPNKLSVRITGDESELREATKRAKQDIQSVSDAALSLGDIAKGTALGTTAAHAFMAIFKKVASVVRESVQAFDDASASMTKLATVMTQRGATQQQYNEVLALTNAEEKLGVVSATAMQNGLQELATYVGQAESLKKLTNTMNNLIVQQHGYNASAEQALQTATMMGKVLQGQTGGMERIGYHLDEADKALFNYGTEEERVALLTSIVNENLGDMNHALGQTDTGKQIQLANTWAQLKEQVGELARAVGRVLIPVFSAVANVVGRAIAYVKAFLKLFGIQTGNSANGTAAAVTGAADAVNDYGDAAAGAAKKAKKALAAFDEMNVLTEQTNSGSGGDSGGVDILGDLEASSEAINWDSLIPDIDLPEWVNKIKNLFDDIDFSRLQASMEKFWNTLKKAIKNVLKIGEKMIENFIVPLVQFAAENAVPRIFDAISDAIDGINFDAITEAAGHVFSALAGIGTILMDAFAGVAEALSPIITWLANFVVPPALEAIGVVLRTIGSIIGGIWDAVSAFYESAIKPLLDALAGVFEPILKFLNDIFGALNENSGAWEGLRGIIGGVAEFLLNILKPAFDVITWVLNNVVKPAIEGVIGFFRFFTDLLGITSSNTREYESTQDRLEQATTRAAEASERQKQAIEDVNNAQLAASNAELRLLDLTKEATEKRNKYNNMVNAGTYSQEDLTRAQLEAEIAEGRLEAQMEELKTATQKTIDAEEEYANSITTEIAETTRAEMYRKAAEGDFEGIYIALEELMHGEHEFALQSGKSFTMTEDQCRSMAGGILEEIDNTEKGFSNWLDWTEEIGHNIRGVFSRLKESARDNLADTAPSGEAFADGVARGIIKNKWVVQNAARELAEAGKTTFNYVLSIKSPSRVMMKSGVNFAEGVEIGVEKEIPALEKITSAMGTAMVDAFNTAPKFRDLGSIDIADQFGELTARAQGTLELQNESTTDAIDQLAQAISNLANQDQRVTVKIGEETLIDKVVDGINNASRMRNQTVLQL